MVHAPRTAFTQLQPLSAPNSRDKARTAMTTPTMIEFETAPGMGANPKTHGVMISHRPASRLMPLANVTVSVMRERYVMVFLLLPNSVQHRPCHMRASAATAMPRGYCQVDVSMQVSRLHVVSARGAREVS